MQDIVANRITKLPFMALHRITGEPLSGAIVSIKRESDDLWWDGSTWQSEIAYLPMTHIIQGAHEYAITFTSSGDYQIIYTHPDGFMVNFSEEITVYPENRLGDDDLDAALRGEGANEGTVTIVTDADIPVADADVWVTTDSAGVNVVAGTIQTDSTGAVTLWLDSGVTYYVWAQKDGKNFSNPYEVIW